MIIQNGFVFGEDKVFARRDLYTENGQIVANPSQLTDKTILDASGLYVLPGFIDIHSHGAMGYDFSDGDSQGLRSILRYERAHGITTYCPTTMSLPIPQLKQALNSPNIPLSDKESARIAGIHMEGPFLDSAKKGAHQQQHLTAPDIELFRECSRCCQHPIKLITIAPNLPGAMDFIQELKDTTTISLGHTNAGYETCLAALQAGASHITHLFNAMTPWSHREPGLIGAAAEASHCMAELICYGIHVHPNMVRTAFRLFTDRIVLISDSMRATGLSDGTYDLGGQQVQVSGRLATLADGTIAGSVTNLYDCMLTAISFGIPKEDAIAAATCNPARSIGIYDSVGSLTPGKRADILLADKNLHLVRVL